MATNESERRALRSYLHILDLLKEPDLCADEVVHRSSEAFRVLKLPSFLPMVAVRAEVSSSGILLVRTIAVGRELERCEGAIEAEKFARIGDAWRSEELWRDDRRRQLGLDGESWVFEWRAGEQYCMAESWSPDARGRDADLSDAGEKLLALASRQFGVRYYY